MSETTSASTASAPVVVTGAASGIGAAVVGRLLADRIPVIAADLSWPADAPERPSVHRVMLDVRDPEGWAAVAELAAASTAAAGALAGLVNAAGITRRARMENVTAEDFELAFAVNATGPALGIKALAPLMAGGASIVNVGSAAAVTAHYAVAYAASKWALRGITKTAAMELGSRGIRVNIVHPGYIETPMTASASVAFRDINVELTPLGRTGSPAEVADVISSLLSPATSFVTGAELAVDGGLTAHGGGLPIARAIS
ncbi:3alpha(or 20beta)-hydroxysteroid dehydrogenase [Pseudoclavibacter sp. JAI123]|uniref:SDR family NAD(P)-dependent oxidoreductase n=1 Tax=Pseudoclavibacter sp. JAI123 TaxID=2723065 RepID=UPI0015CD9DC1|nr:SDR family oxidoreductase [Pseudoclavibacter sp. JAI123]NYF14901.1 3alpha(or 20beta)-hydroxysteroid dehydrogenase [Pseudoclavibacter sp. JAI123]